MREIVIGLILAFIMTIIGISLEDRIGSFFHRIFNRKRLRNKSDNYENIMRQQAKFKKICIVIIGICIALIIFVLVVSRIY